MYKTVTPQNNTESGLQPRFSITFGATKVAIPMITLLFMSFATLANTETQDFLSQQFEKHIPKPQRIWIDKKMQAVIKSQFNPSQIKLSYRYWQKSDVTVWVLEEIGKERNITTGIVIENEKIKTVQVLVYRESRGGQVQNQRFTQQYYQKSSLSNLIKEIDSISGATLSVNALNKQVRLALWLDKNR